MEVRDAAHRAVIRALSQMTLSWIAAVLPSGDVHSGPEGDDAERLTEHHNVSLGRFARCTAAETPAGLDF